MQIIALTGGIASGKSTVSHLFHTLYNISVIDTDIIARSLLNNTHIINKIKCTLGMEVFQNNTLSRKKLRQNIFSNEGKRQQLNAIMHPVIYQEVDQQLLSLPVMPYCIVVIPLLLETSHNYLWKHYDRILLVDTDRELQLERVQKRDNITRKEAENILHIQANREQRQHIAQDIILNNQDMHHLQHQVTLLHNRYITL